MIAEAYIENNEMRVVNFPKDAFMKAKHWKINIEPIEVIKDDDNLDDFISRMTQTPVIVSEDITFLSREVANAR